ncbi:MAG: DUF3048 domain-containing protein [Anaerolineae bacterium]
MENKFKTLLGFSLFGLMLFLVACGSEPQAIEPVVEEAVSTSVPAATITVTLPPTPTTPPTLPPPPVVEVEQAVPTAIPTDPPPPTESADTVPALSGLVLASPEDFGDNRNPLTGEEVDPSRLQRRPLAVKISNSPPLYVRPQSGLNDADLVFEHITEGSLTRLTMIVYGDNPEKMGPIRSARLIDVELPAMYDAALVYSGASTGVNNKLFASDFSERILGAGNIGYYRTGENKPTEHTLYGNPVGLREALDSKGENRAPSFGKRMSFSSEAPPGGSSASQISLNFIWENVTWTYDAATNRYYRYAAGVPHNDGNTNQQVSTTNIVVPFINHVDDPNICEEIRNNACHLLSVEIQLWGSGSVAIFRDGQRYDGTWKREARNDMLTFYDESGTQIPLQIGNSWVELMSIWYNDPLQVTP